MSKTKKFRPISNTVNTVIHWYEEVQDLPDTLKKRVDADIQKSEKLVKRLKAQLEKAHKLQSKTREKRIDSATRVKIKATAGAKKVLSKSKSAYNKATKTVNNLMKKIDKAQSQLHNAQIRQKYYQALTHAFTTVTDLFHKKHGAKKKPNPKKKHKKSR